VHPSHREAFQNSKSQIENPNFAVVFVKISPKLVESNFPTNEIAMRKYSQQPTMNMWIFHQVIEKQNLY